MNTNPLHTRLVDLFRDRVAVLLALLVLLFPVAKGANAAVALWLYVRSRQEGDVVTLPREFRIGTLLLLAAFVVGLLVTGNIRDTLAALFALVMALVFVWGVRRYAFLGDGRLQPAFLAAAVMLILIAVPTWAFWQWLEGPFLYRLHGVAPFTTRNLWSCTLTLTWVVLLAILLRNDMTIRHGYLALALLALVGMLLVANSTPEALVAACAASFVMVAVRFPARKIVAGGLAAAAIVLLFWVVAPTSGWQSHLLRHDVERSDRLVVWRTTWELVQQRPLLGYGPGTFKSSPEVNALLPESQRNPASPHNWPLELLYSFGILGTVLYVAGLVAIARAVRRSFPHPSAYLKLVGAGFLTVVLVNGLVDFRMLGVFFQCTLLAAGYLVLAWRPATHPGSGSVA